MKNLLIILILSSCASRGLLLSDQIPELNSEINNPELIGFIEEGVELKKSNFKYLYKKKYLKLKRSIASQHNREEFEKSDLEIDSFSSSFDAIEATIEEQDYGILIN